MKKPVTQLYIALFVIVLGLSNFIFPLCRSFTDNTNYEKRQPNPAPVVGQTAYKDFAKSFDDYYNDRIPFRNELITLNNRINYYAFHSNMFDQVLIGKDGWLFLEDVVQGDTIADYTGRYTAEEAELSQMAAGLMRIKEALETQGIEFVIFIAPNKARVYAEYLPDYLGEPAQIYATGQIVDYLSQNTDITVLYEYDSLMRAKRELSDNALLYHKADTHWNKLGAYVGAKDLLKALGGELPELTSADVKYEAVNGDETDLATMIYMTSDFMSNEVDYQVSGYETNNVRLIDNDFNEVISYESDAEDDRTVYICRDSFATDMGEYIGSQFAHTYMRHQNTFTVEDMQNVKPDVFVFEVAERAALYRLTELSKALQ